MRQPNVPADTCPWSLSLLSIRWKLAIGMSSLSVWPGPIPPIFSPSHPPGHLGDTFLHHHPDHHLPLTCHTGRCRSPVPREEPPCSGCEEERPLALGSQEAVAIPSLGEWSPRAPSWSFGTPHTGVVALPGSVLLTLVFFPSFPSFRWQWQLVTRRGGICSAARGAVGKARCVFFLPALLVLYAVSWVKQLCCLLPIYCLVGDHQTYSYAAAKHTESLRPRASNLKPTLWLMA